MSRVTYIQAARLTYGDTQHHNVNADTYTQYQWSQSSLMMIGINEEVSGGDDVDDDDDDDDDDQYDLERVP